MCDSSMKDTLYRSIPGVEADRLAERLRLTKGRTQDNSGASAAVVALQIAQQRAPRAAVEPPTMEQAMAIKTSAGEDMSQPQIPSVDAASTWASRLLERRFNATASGHALRQLGARVDELQRQLPAHAARQEVQLAEVRDQVRDLGAEITRLAKVLQADAEDVRRQFVDHRRHVEHELASLQAALSFHDRRLSRLGDPRAATERPSARTSLEEPGCDRLHLAILEMLQPEREPAKDHLRPVLECLRAVWPGVADRPLLDIAPGLGEWLELAASAGLPAYGVDANGYSVDLCRAAGLSVHHEDPLVHLQALPDSVLGGVSACGSVEAFPLAVVAALLEEARRTIMPGGVVVLIMRDPARLTVPSLYYVDPVRRHFVPEPVARLLIQHEGFSALETVPLSAADANGDGLTLAPGYALLARRP